MRKRTGKLWKRISAMMLAATMIVAVVPAAANAEVVKKDGVWVNVENGQVYNGGSPYAGRGYYYCAKNPTNNTWWAIDEDGKVDFTFNGFAGNDNGWWYCKNGQVDFTANGVFWDDEDKLWYPVKNGQMEDTYETLRKNSAGWWYIGESGYVDFEYTGFCQYNGYNWYVENGKVDLNRTGLIKVDGDYYNIVKGRITAGPTLVKNSLGWWYVDKNGKVDFDFYSTENGLVKYNGYWWYIEAGKLNFSTSGFFKNTSYNGDYFWYIKDGKVDTSLTTLGYEKDSGENGASDWWYVKGGHLATISSPTLVKYNGTWWYVNPTSDGYGNVNFKAQTLQKYNGTWWVVINGKVDFSWRGIFKNDAGTWYCKDGRVDFSKNGKIVYQGKTYTVTNGKVAM